MGLFKRINDIISANLNEMIEGFENPETMLKQAIREMESSIAQVKQETARAMASEKLGEFISYAAGRPGDEHGRHTRF